jgi:Tfp pilus assembly protein PilZ
MELFWGNMKTLVEENPSLNRRTLPRKPVMVLEVKGKQFDKVFLAYAENLGLGGLRLSSSHPLKIGDHFPVEFILPDQITKIACTCEVVWRYNSGSDSEGLGVRFLDLSQQLKKVIGTWIDEDKHNKKN